MIDNVLIAKIVGGVSVIGGSGGVVYAYSDVLKNYFFDTSIRSYLVKEVEAQAVKTTAVTSSGSSTSPALYENNNEKKKLFSCGMDSSEEVDESCDLFELTDKAKGFANLKDLNTDKPTKSQTFAKEKYYKLTIDTSKFSKWNEDKLPTININGSSKTKISSLKLLLRTDKIKKETKTNVVIATLDTAITSSEGTLDLSKAKCKIGTPEGSDVSCSLIYKIEGGNKDVSSVDFSKLTKITSLNNTDGVKDNFFIISFDEKDTSKLIFEKEKNKIVISQNNKTASLSFSSFVFGKLEETVTNNNVVVIDELKAVTD